MGKQMDYIRRGSNLNTITILLILGIVLFVILNDYMDFASSEKTIVITKIIFGICMIVSVGLLVQRTKNMDERVSYMIHQEKK